LPADLAQHTCLLYKFPSSGKVEAWPLPEWPTLQAAGLPALLNCNNVDTLLHFAESGLGIAALPDFAVRAALAAGRLQPLLDAHRQHDGAFRILWPSSRHLTPKLRAFIDFLARHVFPES
jgi:DNA-binding transcriptional LysR family regulator